MVLKINIKMKDPRFKGDRPRYHAVVSGPTETMTERMRRFLELQGLSPFKEEDGFSIWSCPPAIGGPPAYLVPLLEQRHKISPTREARDFANRAFGEVVSEDGLERFLGPGAGVSPGKTALHVLAGSEDFVANCDADNPARCAALEAAGWLPIENPGQQLSQKMGTQPYRTRDPFVAGNLAPFMTDAAQARLKEKNRAASANIALSKSQTAPKDFDVPVPEGLDYLDFQKGGIQQIAASEKSGIIADDMGLGKAQPLDANVLTPSGWRKMGEIVVGDDVIGSDGAPTRVVGVYPQGVKEIFRVDFTDGSSTRCCDDHLWKVFTPTRKNRGHPGRVLSLSEIRADMKDAAGNLKHYVPLVEPVQKPEASLPIDPYVLGVLLGDGGLTSRVTLSDPDDEVIDRVKTTLPDTLKMVRVSGCDHRIASERPGAPNAYRRVLEKLGLAGLKSEEKFVPPAYLEGSVSQRVSLLQGLMDTDGFAARDGTIQFSSNSRALREAVRDIVMSLGGVARRSSKISASGKTHYATTIAMPDDIPPFALSRKLVRHGPRRKYKPTRGILSVTPVGLKPAQCIAVAARDRLYVTDDYVVTHNTIQGIGLMNGRPEARNVLVTCQANMRLKWAREIEKWQTSDRSVGVAEGPNFPDTDVVVINYDILQKNIDKLRARNWDVILTDEAHNLKNEEAQRTKAVLGDVLDPEAEEMLPISRKGQLVHLTGTPKPNRVSELWTLLTSSRPDLWGRGAKAREVFLNRYQPPVLIKQKMRRGNREFESIIPMQGKPIRETELQLRLRGSGSFVRRLKRDTDLPPKFRTPLDVPVRLSKQEKEMLREAEADLDSIVGRVNGAVKAGQSKEAGAVIDAISLVDPDVPDFSELARVRRNLGLVKAPHCAKFIMDELEDEQDMAPENRTKTVVFAHHREVISKIHGEAEKRMKGAVLVYDGSSGSARKRQEIIDRFQSDDDVRGIIISLAGATGITLTAGARMRVVEPDWTPSNMVQIEDRIWRIGQEFNVDIGYMSVAGTLDARVGAALVEKMESDEKSMNTISFKHAKKPEKDAGHEPQNDETETSTADDDAQPSLPL